ncbi:hypothetical protein M408DRAFT_329280 [Serendipita vermifera MAFF 305830]|uniref:Uncharacterized protein n=1 Tax=Serendipita vermifera MAFF 305830 TaxID=933852 RepID=A0A0C2WRQ6_SERVB|nr:hypothetical protein M408DRAFT_329280 [Serendipita vermifera MAFF 305830]
MRQIREAERARAVKLQSKLIAESKEPRELEKQSVVTDIVTTLVVVVYGGEMICSPWLQFTPSFLTNHRYPLLFAVAQVFISNLPAVPAMSFQTELPLSFFDGLTRVLLLTAGCPGFILKHASPAISSSPWALMVTSLIMANGGFFLVNLFQMLSPYGWHIKTPPEFLPGGWRTMDLWVAPLITVVHALFTHSQESLVPYHHQLVHKIGSPTMFGGLEYISENEGPTVAVTKPMGEADARSLCAVVLCALFAYRTIINFGIDWNRTPSGVQAKRKHVIRSKHDGKRLSKDNIKATHKSG